MEHEVARILAETEQPVEVYAAALAAIGRCLDWELGSVWEADPKGERLHCVKTWHAGVVVTEFEALSERLELGLGEGLPGRVLLTGEPMWLVDAPTDGNFPRAGAARRTGLHAAFGFPLPSPRGLVGVMEFFSRELREPDAELLRTMRVVGSQVGQFVARRHAEAEVRASESRLRAMLAAALDAVVNMDERGCVTGWNPAAEATFGYSAEDARGREMAELIVPPSLRERHREGFARCVREGGGQLLDRRIEITGMRADGSEFPVELTITRIEVPGAPRFTGFVRDITERHLAEAELRASRARIVEAGDEARRRIERNLHDGAQQRLVNVSLGLRLARAQVEQSPREAAELLEDALDELKLATSELRELARGIHPAVLSDGGLEPAIAGLVSGSQTRVRMEEVTAERFPPSV